LMLRKPRNIRTDRLTDWRFFVQIYLFIGIFGWLSAMGMWFWFWSTEATNSAGKQIPLGISDLLFAYESWPTNTTNTRDVWPHGHGMNASDLATNVNIGASIYYITMVVVQFGALLATRNRRVSLLRSNPLWGPHKNLWILGGYVSSATFAVLNVYVRPVRNEFDTAPIPAKHWFIPFVFAIVLLVCDEVRKLIVRTYPKSWVA
ncbi:cation-transporting P-type ATPase, partial [Blyttiomyces helicus]